jgi:hypothetical protein
LDAPRQPGARYLATEGAAIEALSELISAPLALDAGEVLALEGPNNHAKHFFCDWLLGFVKVDGGRVRIQAGKRHADSPEDRNAMASVLGRSPLLYGDTIQESLLYRTRGVRKQDLYSLVERLFGPSLRGKTSPENPLFDGNGKPIAPQTLTAREHLEVAQINVILQQTPLVILDLSSELMREALVEGFRPAPELTRSGRTLIVIVPQGKNTAWAESVLGRKFDRTLQFE